jgi:hypothetical protein
MINAARRLEWRRAAEQWFAVDLRSLAAMRIVLATALLVRIVSVWPDAIAFLSDEGVLPRRLLLHFLEPTTSIYLLNGSPAFALGLLVVNALAATALLIGYRARLAAAICWVLWLSLAQRNPLITTGGDALACALLFWSIFLPISDAFSIDSAVSERTPRSLHLSAASTGLLLQALYVYFFGALLKTGAEWQSEGSAVYLALSFDSIATPMAHWLRQHDWATTAITRGVYWIELLSPLLLFAPIRTALIRAIILPFYICMHLCFAVFLDIGNFWIVSLASLVVFTPSFVWDWLERRLWTPAQRKIAVYYDRDCAFCRKTALLLHTFFLPRDATVAPAQADAEIGPLLEREQSWVVTDAHGARFLHWDALVFVLRQSFWGWPLAAIAQVIGSVGAGRPIYRFIGRRRQVFGRLVSDVRPRVPFRLSPTTQLLLALPLLIALVWNVREYIGARALLSPADKVISVLGWGQHWSMFAPYPQYQYVIPVVEGRLADGRSVDLLSGRDGAPSYEWPRYPIYAAAGPGWRKYFNGLSVHQRRFAPTFYNRYATFLCNRWNRGAAYHLVEARITILRGRTLPGNRSQRTERETFAFSCPR